MRVLVELEQMEFRAFHGCYELEKMVGNRFLVNAAIEAEIGDAPQRDDVNSSINYLTVYELVVAQMKITSNIIENVAERVIDAIYGHYPDAIKVTVKVSKLAPPLGGKVEKVSVTLIK